MLCDVDAIAIELVGQRSLDTVKFSHCADCPSLKTDVSFRSKKLKHAMTNTSALNLNVHFLLEQIPEGHSDVRQKMSADSNAGQNREIAAAGKVIPRGFQAQVEWFSLIVPFTTVDFKSALKRVNYPNVIKFFKLIIYAF